MPLSLRRSGLLLVVTLAVLPALFGCGDGRPKRVKVSGRVLIDDKPLTRGTVRLMPAKDRAAAGEIGPDGRFTLGTFSADDGCVLGTHPVAIVAIRTINANAIEYFVPKQYVDHATSGLTATIDGPNDDLTIKLTWAGGKPYIERTGSGGGDIDPAAL
jgi:hypothetical protein